MGFGVAIGSVRGLSDSRVDVAEEKYAARRADSDCVYSLFVNTWETKKNKKKKLRVVRKLTSLRKEISDCSLCAMWERSVTKCVIAGFGFRGSGSGVSVWL